MEYVRQLEYQPVIKRYLPDFSSTIENAPPDALKNLVYFLIDDLAQHQRTEKWLKTELRTKETLLKETHHRVKNDFERLYHLLAIQESYISEPSARNVLQDNMNRIMSMMLLHKRLQQSSEATMVDFDEYLADFCKQLVQNFKVSRITFTIDNPAKLLLPMPQATTCALILNELITNALKHAFTEDQEGEIRVLFRDNHDGYLIFEVKDNGRGVPDDVLQNHPLDSLGLQLVYDLVTHQLNGKLDIERNGGTTFTVTFPK